MPGFKSRLCIDKHTLYSYRYDQLILLKGDCYRGVTALKNLKELDFIIYLTDTRLISKIQILFSIYVFMFPF